MIELAAVRGWRGGMAILIVAAGLSLAASSSQARTRTHTEMVTGGTTRIELSRPLFQGLAHAGVRVSKVGSGTVRGRIVTLAVDGGQIELGTAIGFVDHAGGFKFRSEGGAATLSQPVLNTANGGLYAKLDGRPLKIAAVKSFDFSRAGFGDEVEAANLRLSRETVDILNRKLRLDRVFRPGRAFATVSAGFQPATDQMESGSMQFSLDPGTVAKLKSLEVEPVPFETAVLGGNPLTYGAPLIGGMIYPGESRSWGFLEGGIRIAKVVEPERALTFPVLTFINLGLSLETQKVLGYIHAHNTSGQLAPTPGGPIAALDLSAATVQLDPQTRTLTIANAKATLEASTANLINETFALPKGKAPALAAGDPLGTFSLTMQGR